MSAEKDCDQLLNNHESMVEDLLHRGRHSRTISLMARLARALENGGELEIFVPCRSCSAPIALAGAPDGRCTDCRRAG